MNVATPNWNEIFQTIGAQLRLRGGLLTKRVVLISLPGLAALFLLRFFSGMRNLLHLQDLNEFAPNAVFYITLYLIVTAIVTIVFMAILKIEQVVWLDSYFDDKNLSPQESWRIARRLYWDWGYLQFKLFYRYYLWIVLAIPVAIALGAYSFIFSDFARSIPPSTVPTVTLLYAFSIGAALIFWTRALKVKLSYAPFLFLDRYRGGIVQSSGFWRGFFQELHALNSLGGRDSLEKNALLELGADVAMTLVEYIATIMQAGAGFVTTRAGTEVAYRIILFSKLAGRYVLYRYALEALHHKPYKVNDYIYGLKDK